MKKWGQLEPPEMSEMKKWVQLERPEMSGRRNPHANQRILIKIPQTFVLKRIKETNFPRDFKENGAGVPADYSQKLQTDWGERNAPFHKLKNNCLCGSHPFHRLKTGSGKETYPVQTFQTTSGEQTYPDILKKMVQAVANRRILIF